jgi:hypothetical protein
MSVSFDPKFIKFSKSTATSSLLTSLKAWWKMDEASGTVYDSTANDNDLTANDTPTYSASGKIGTAIAFNSDYDALAIASSANTKPSADVFSVSFWLKFSTLPSVGGYTQGLLRINNSAAEGYAVRVCATSDNAIHFIIYNASSTKYEWYTGSNSINDTTTWHHVVCIAKGNGNQGEIWIDNVESDVTDAVQSGNIHSIDGSTCVGNNYAGADEAVYGSLDLYGIWDKALTSTEVGSLYNSGSAVDYPFS